jgi:hypothetical protein
MDQLHAIAALPAQFEKDYNAGNLGVGQVPAEFFAGIGKTLQNHIGGAIQLYQKEQSTEHAPQAWAMQKLGLGKDVPAEREQQMLKEAADWLKQNSDTHGFWEGAGGVGENIGELLGPAELMKLAEAPAAAAKGAQTVEGLTSAQKLQQGAKVAALLKAHPVVDRLVGIGLRALKMGAETGTTAGAQTLVDTGGDTRQAAEAAAAGAAGGGVLGTVAETVTAARAAAAARAAQAAAHEAAPAVEAERTAAMLADRQARAQRGIKDVVRDATENALNRLNEARRPTTRVVPGETVPARAGAGTISEDLAAKGAAGKTGSTASTVPASVVPKNPIIEELGSQAATIPGRIWDEVSGAATEHTTPPNFAPVNAQAIAADTNSFGHGAEKIREAAQPVYDTLDQATGGQFAKLQKARATAYKANDFAKVESTENAIDELLSKKPDQVNAQDYATARSAWRDSKILDRLHAVTEGAFNGISEEMASQPGTGARLLRSGTKEGGSLQTRLGAFLRSEKNIREAQMVIGPDGVANLYRASHLVSNPETAKATKAIAEEVAKQFPAPKPPGIGRKVVDTVAGAAGGAAAAGAAHAVGVPAWAAYPAGAAGGVGVAEGARFVLRRMLTSPKVGQLMEYAVQNRVPAKMAAGLISAQIQREQQGGTQ